ncbi:MAG: DMT family transporter [Halobacteriovoraceae bacterium]|nr:DMT family transporter [Halobacteriovoraceae bacterium]
MKLSFLLPVFIGIIGMLQGGLNRQISNYVGVAQATLISSVVSTLFCFVFFVYVQRNPQFFPSFFHIKSGIFTYKWWFVLPALFGFLIVAGFPYTLAKVGAVNLTIGLIASQAIVSVIWDIFVEGIPINTPKIIGILLSLSGIALTSLSSR